LQRITTKTPTTTTIKSQLVSYISTPTSKMPFFFPQFTELSPIFRLADEIDRATRQSPRHGHGARHVPPTFAPKFDVKETKEAYELVGELPGIEQSNVNIEWADEHTLSISGKTASRYEASSDETATKETPETAESAEAASDALSEKHHQASVEDEEDAVMVEGSDATPETSTETEKPAHSPEEKGKAVTKSEEPKAACQQACRPKNGSRYWVTERSVGTFHRTFTFPGRVDHDAVKASLKNGVLNVSVPKAAPLQPKRVEVN